MPEEGASVTVPVKLWPRQKQALDDMGGDPPASQFIRDAVEEALMKYVPGYAAEHYNYTGTGFPE